MPASAASRTAAARFHQSGASRRAPQPPPLSTTTPTPPRTPRASSPSPRASSTRSCSRSCTSCCCGSRSRSSTSTLRSPTPTSTFPTCATTCAASCRVRRGAGRRGVCRRAASLALEPGGPLGAANPTQPRAAAARPAPPRPAPPRPAPPRPAPGEVSLFALSSSNAVVQMLGRSGPRVVTAQMDSKRDLEQQLKATCENFIMVRPPAAGGGWVGGWVGSSRTWGSSTRGLPGPAPAAAGSPPQFGCCPNAAGPRLPNPCPRPCHHRATPSPTPQHRP
jgi:hypothetical protein